MPRNAACGVIRDQKWQGKLIKKKWDDENLSRKGSFSWLKECATHIIAGMFELYEQMLPTRLYTSQKIRTTPGSEILCRLCGKFPESVPHVLAGCSALAQNKYLSRQCGLEDSVFFSCYEI